MVFRKIMFKQYLFLFIFVLIRVSCQEVVSTTQKSSNELSNSPELKEINCRLLALELQNAQFQKSLEKQCRLDEEKLSNILATLQNNVTATCDTKLENNENQTSTVNDSSACSINLLNKTTQQIIAKIDKKQEEFLTLFEAELQKATEKLITKMGKEQENLLSQFEAKLQKMEERIAAKIDKILEDELEDKQLKRKKKRQETTNGCLEYQKAGQNTSGVYSLKAASGELYSVYCDMATKGGGWVLILNRFDGSENFDVNWNAYKDGFGEPSGEFWLGLKRLYQLTHSGDYELLVNLMDWDDKKVYAFYTKFEIGSENEDYSLKVIEGYSGDAGDGLSSLQGMRFSTKDEDNDLSSTTNCAVAYKGGWWFKTCYTDASKLTGIYLKKASKSFTADGIHWLPLHHGSLKEAKMMIRPRRKI